MVESQYPSLSSHIILERKCQCQARQEDSLTDGKAQVMEDPGPFEDSSALGEGQEPCLLTASDGFQ